MLDLAQRISNIKPSTTLVIMAKAKALRAQGRDVISFSAGEPDFPTPDYIKAAAVEAINHSANGYPPAAGIPELRRAVADKLRADNELDYSWEQIVVSCGAKGAIANALLALVDPGDRVVIPTPYWVSYPDLVQLAAGIPVYLPASIDDGFVPHREDLERVVAEGPVKAIIYSSPSNPAGTLYNEKVLRELADWAMTHDVAIISDEIYEKLVFTGKHISILNVAPEAKDRTVVVNGLSKAYAMTGWRVGYSASPQAWANAFATIQGHLYTNTATLVQRAAVTALQGDQTPVREMHDKFDERRKLMHKRLCALPGVTCAAPQGAFYCFPDVSQWYGRTVKGFHVHDSVTFADMVLNTVEVALVPGDAFGMDGHVRLSYACSMDDIERGMARLADLLSNP